MKRLDKVCNVWSDLDKAYDDYSSKLLAKTGKKITRLAFLAKLLNYTGTEDDMTRFKAMFSNEVKTYTDSELQRYEELLETVNDFWSILTLCMPDKDGHKTFSVDDTLTIKEIRECISDYLQNSTNALEKMDMFSMDLKYDESHNNSTVVEQPKKLNLNDYYIVKSKSNCTPKELFSQGKLSNYFESTKDGIKYLCAPSISDDYVYIDDKASLLNYLYSISCDSRGSNSFKKAVYTFLLNACNAESKVKGSLSFPYVFISTGLLEETPNQFRVGKLAFRKAKLHISHLKGKTCKDLINNEIFNTEEIYKIETTNAGINYTVGLVGNLEL